MADGKWIPDLTPDTPLEEAARRALRLRLQVVADNLPKAIAEADKDAEHVHQLRVATRRADAALKLFRLCLPRKAYRRSRKRLRRIRRAAGAARDWDVFLMALAGRAAEAPPAQLPGIDFLIGHALGHRQAAQTALAELEQDDFAELAAGVLDAVRPAGEGELALLGELARPLIAARLDRLERAASGDLGHYEQLHEARIQGKRLRYAMEVLADCFPPRFKEDLYPRVEEMQEILGRANDSHVACGRLAEARRQLKAWPETWARVKAGVEALLRFHQRRLPQERRRFVERWRQWQQARVEDVLSSGGQRAM